MQRKRLRLLAGTVLTGALLITGALSAGANELISVSTGSATVDGLTTDWDLDATDGASDWIGAMYRSGGSDHDVLANLYGKAQDGTLYLLALATDHTVDMSSPEVWVAFNSNDNKVFPVFVPVLDGDLNVVGWEAAVALPEDGVTSINVHTNWDDGQTGALARGNGMIDFTIVEPPLEDDDDLCVEYTGDELAELMAGESTVDAGTATLGGIPEDACEFELTFTSYELPGGGIEPSEDQVVFDTTDTLTVSAENNGDILEIDTPDCVWLTSLYTGELVENGQLVEDIVIGWDATTMTAEELAVCTGDDDDDVIIDDDDDVVIDDDDDVIIEEDDVVEDEDDVVVEEEVVTVVDSDQTVTETVVEEEADVLGVALEQPAAPAAQVEVSGAELAATGLDTGTLLWLAMLAGLLGAGLVTSTRRFDVG